VLEYVCFSSGECTVHGVGDWNGTELVIPAILGGCRVTGIGNNLFLGCYEDVVSVKIPSSVTKIAKYAFGGARISHIYYDGTMEQWEAIEREPKWDLYVHNCTVHCADGDIFVK
jgi:hypothetical protein